MWMRISAALLGLTISGANAGPTCGRVFLSAPEGPGWLQGFASAGDVAYSTNGEGIVVLHRVGGGPPSVHGVVPFPTMFEVAVDGDELYALSYPGLLMVYDISDRLDPVPIGQTSIPGDPWELHVANGVLVTRTRNGIEILDISDPASPSRAHVMLGGHFGEVTTNGDLLLAEERFGRIVIYDIADLASPAEVGSIQLASGTRRLAIRDRVLFASSYKGVRAFDVSSPASPRPLGGLDGYTSDFRLDGEDLYIDSYGSLSRVDVSDPSEFEVIATVPISGDFFNFAWQGFALTSNGGTGMWDMHAPRTEPAGVTEATGAIHGLIGHAGVLYAMTDNGVAVFTLDDPTSPELRAVVAGHEPVWHGEVEDGLLFVAAGDRGLLVLDVSEPELPMVIGWIETGASVRGVDVDGGIAFLAATDAFQMVDVSDPAVPRLVNSVELETVYHTPTARRVVVDGAMAYVSDWAAGIRPFDVSDLSDVVASEPVEFDNHAVSDLLLLPGFGVASGGGGAYLAKRTAPDAFESFDYLRINGGVRDIDRVGGTLIFTSSTIVQMIDVSDPSAPAYGRTIVLPMADGPQSPQASFGSSEAVGGWLYTSDRDRMLVFDPTPCGVCRADVTHDGRLNQDDIGAFVGAFQAMSLGADLDGDGAVSLDDLDAFAAAFLGGCP